MVCFIHSYQVTNELDIYPHTRNSEISEFRDSDPTGEAVLRLSTGKSREGKIRVSEFRDLDPPGKVILRLSTSKQARPDLGFKYPNHFSHESRILSHQTCLMFCLWKDSKRVPDGPPKLGIRRFPQTPPQASKQIRPNLGF